MKKIIITALLLSVFLAGCSGLTGGVSGVASGVIIKSFRPDIPEIYSSDLAVFTLTVENVGEEDAAGVTAKMFGLGTDWSYTGGYKLPLQTLNRAQSDIPGGTTDFYWEATAPSGLKVDNTYTASVRLRYRYSTTAVGNLKVYNSDYLRTRPEEASSVAKSSGLDSFTVTRSPLTISLAGAARPIIYRGGDQTYTVTALIENVGQGHPFWSEENDMEIRINSMSVAGQECVSAQTVRIPRDGKKAVNCQFDVPSVSEFTTVPVEVEISYNYFVDSSASIKVLAEVV